MKPVQVFYYGLFMDPDILREQGLSPGDHIKARLDEYELLLGERATMVPNPAKQVWGTVMSLNEQELKKLYEAPSVADYRTHNIKCFTEEGEKLDAITYILPEGYPLSPPRNADYAKKLLAICKKINIPKSYYEQINTIITNIENKEKAEK